MKHLKPIVPLFLFPLAAAAQESFPVLTTEGDTVWYALSTPQRDNLYITNNGDNVDLDGTAVTYADNQLWCFVAVGEEGRFNMLSRDGGLYMADTPTGNYYRATSTAPETGFTMPEVQDGLYNLSDANGDLVNLCLADQYHKLTPYNYPTDAGNLFQVEEVDAATAAISAAKASAQSFYDATLEGTDPGAFSAEARAAFLAAFQAAETVDEVNQAMDEYKSRVNTVVEGQYYFIVSTGPSYCNGRVLYNTKPTAGAYQRWGDKTLDENALWEFVPVEGNDTLTYQMRNKATGLYLTATSVPSSSGEVRGADEPGTNGAFELEPLYEDASFLIYVPGGNPIHAQQNYGVMVTWNNSDYGSASSWKIVAATDDELAQAEEKTAEDENDYILVWNDEFDSDEINTGYWGFGEGFQRNNEDQWYQEDNASIEDGILVIEARKEQRPNPWYVEGSSDWRYSRENIDYTSSLLSTSGKYDFCYGRLEVLAQIPCISGSWPAIWLLGNESVTGPWPSSGEIDVMEYYRDMTLANLCWGSVAQWAGNWESRSTPVTNYWVNQDANWTTAYHKWRMDWDEESIKLYVDDELITICALERTINEGSWWLVENPFRTNQYILINLALGGNNGGTIDDSQMPFRYCVDYVRVWQKPRHVPTGVASVTAGRETALVTYEGGQPVLDMSGFSGEVKVSVYDLSGRIVHSATADAASSSSLLDVTRLVPGTYVVKATDSSTARSQKVRIR